MVLRNLLRSAFVVSVLLALLSTSFGTAGAQSLATERAPARPLSASGQNELPLLFLANTGQLDPVVRFEASANNQTLSFMGSSIAFNLPVVLGPEVVACANPNMQLGAMLVARSILRLTFDNAASNPELDGTGQLPGIANPIIDGIPILWRTNEAPYTSVTYRELYPGIDLNFAGFDGKLTATFSLAAGVSPSRISWHYDSADSLFEIATGDLHVYTPDGGLLNNYAPAAWQVRNGVQTPVDIGYQVTADNEIRFGSLFAGYDPSLPLTIALNLG